jgi:hypothetical protein
VSSTTTTTTTSTSTTAFLVPDGLRSTDLGTGKADLGDAIGAMGVPLDLMAQRVCAMALEPRAVRDEDVRVAAVVAHVSYKPREIDGLIILLL